MDKNYSLKRIEGVLARGDRRLGKVIEAAFTSGARFDNWSDLLHIESWNRAFIECGIDPASYLKKREYDEIFPWDYVEAGISKDTLLRENEDAHNQSGIL